MNANPMQLPPGHGPVSPEGHFNGGHNGNNLNNHHLNNQHQNHQSHAGNPPRHNLGNGVIPPIGNGGGRGPQRNGSGFGSGAPNHHGGHNNANGPGAGGNGKHRGPVPPAARSAWSYGPGVGDGRDSC
ncbi:hypothetical protein NLJ89_g10523 [Agrocybe chaxingu]|uniref:Uncharacterized protein n=1 Tax=Agrocybe chaxingu TaxID=84603 RepID=A0A9W8JYJ1_9AGAR|nr:hypothetical protein NLJ89_g10523 [Agrocybe chaxingu]